MPDLPETTTVGALAAPAAAVEPWLPERVVAGRYEIRGFRGRGGAGTVYHAFDRLLRLEVALKIVHPERDQGKVLARLRREVAAARECSSPHLVRVFEVGASAEGVFLTMEFLQGGSLRERLKAGQLPIEEALRVAEAVLAGLQALHAKGIVHRDVTPGNILFSEKGGVKLGDFGLVRGVHEEETRITEGPGVVGTAGYLSPEAARGREVGPASDLYQLGVVLFEMLAGRRPHAVASELGARLAPLLSPPSVRKFRPQMPRWLARLISRLLEARPADRYPSAAAALLDLRAHRAPGRPRLRRRILRAAAILVLLLPQLGILVPRVGGARFSHLVPTETGIAGIGRAGERLWTIGNVAPEIARQSALARITPGGPRLVAAVLHRPLEWSPEVVSTLSFLDPETGKVVRRKKLPDYRGVFPTDPPRFMPASVTAVDLDHDGVDEILVSYTHFPEAPSYTVLYSPRLDRSRVVFFARGHHRFQGAVDLAGDGKPDLLFEGINNGWVWVNAVAAVRLDYPLADADWDDAPAGAPDVIAGPEGERHLLWYATLPRGDLQAPYCLEIDAPRRRLIARYLSGRTVTLGFDGFVTEPSGALASPLRTEARAEAYRHFRESDRLRKSGAFELAMSEARAAGEAATRAREPWLSEYAERQEAKVLVAEGKPREADARFGAIAESAEDAPEVAYDAAEAFHLHGDLRRAVAWYARGLGRGAAMGAGKSKLEFLKGEVLAQVEQKRYAEAREAVARFLAAYPGFEPSLPIYREYVEWRAGGHPQAVAVAVNQPDLNRYWQLEIDFARDRDPHDLLGRVERLLAENPVTRAELLSLQAELLARLGRVEEARDAAWKALGLVRADKAQSIVARAHETLVEERAGRLGAKSSGRSIAASP